MANDYYGNCAKCGKPLYFKNGPNKNGSYTFTCYGCGANTTRSAIPAQFESEYVDRLIRNGDELLWGLIKALGRLGCDLSDSDCYEWITGWRALVELRNG